MEQKTIQLDKYLEFQDADRIRIRGHRLGIENVLTYYLEGYSPDEIAQEFPGLELETVYVTITYYLANQTELNAYLTRWRKRNEQAYQEWVSHPSPLIERLRAVREQQTSYESSLSA